MICLQIRPKLSANIASRRNSRLQQSGVSARLPFTVKTWFVIRLILSAYPCIIDFVLTGERMVRSIGDYLHKKDYFQPATKLDSSG